MAYEDAKNAVRVWARVNDDGKVYWPGPDGLGCRGDKVPDGLASKDLRLWFQVEKTLKCFAPKTHVLREVLKHKFLHEREIGSYHLFPYPPPHPLAIPREVLGLGIDQPTLLKIAVKRFLETLEYDLRSFVRLERKRVEIPIVED